MLACVDVDYRGDEGPAVASCVVYEDWDSSESREERVAVIPRVAPYTSGQFFQRELPCILLVLEKVQTPLDAILVDGHVWLDDVDVAAQSVRRMHGAHRMPSLLTRADQLCRTVPMLESFVDP